MPAIEKYNLRPLETEDLELVLNWRNSDRIRTNMYSSELISMAEHLKWFETLNPEYTDYMIFEYEGSPAGLSYLTNIDLYNSKCEWGFYIGREALPRGSGTVMGYLSLERAFKEKKLRKVYGEVLEFNHASCKFFERLGFSQDGCLRKHVLKDNIYVAVMLFSLLSDEWAEQHSIRILNMLKEQTVEIG